MEGRAIAAPTHYLTRPEAAVIAALPLLPRARSCRVRKTRVPRFSERTHIRNLRCTKLLSPSNLLREPSDASKSSNVKSPSFISLQVKNEPGNRYEILEELLSKL
jgi:hypothetical protein